MFDVFQNLQLLSYCF